MTSVFVSFCWLDRLTELCPLVPYHFACQPGRGREVLDGQADTGYLFSPADCEISQIVKSHHEKAKRALIREDLGGRLRRVIQDRAIGPCEGLIVEHGLTSAALPVVPVPAQASNLAA
jgi:hypothetical protein